MSPCWYYWWSAIVAGIGAIASIILAILGCWQLPAISKSLRNSVLGNVIGLEKTISDNRRYVAQVAQEKKRDRKWRLRFEEAIENYLNSLDRLCASIRRGIIPEHQYRDDYAKMLADVIRLYPCKLGDDTEFDNIKFLHDKWNRT